MCELVKYSRTFVLPLSFCFTVDAFKIILYSYKDKKNHVDFHPTSTGRSEGHVALGDPVQKFDMKTKKLFFSVAILKKIKHV